MTSAAAPRYVDYWPEPVVLYHPAEALARREAVAVAEGASWLTPWTTTAGGRKDEGEAGARGGSHPPPPAAS